MTNLIEELRLPPGRLVQGSLYEPQTTDALNNPLVHKTGVKAGQPRVNFYFGLAIQKGQELHWAETEWGKKIWAIGHAGFPSGQASRSNFAWKVSDGDSDVPNSKGNRNIDKEGYPGHWILNFTGGQPPTLVTTIGQDGLRNLTSVNEINLGDYIEVFCSVSPNNQMATNSGIYLNHKIVSLCGYGKRIFIVSTDPSAVGFGKSQIPTGASLTPVASSHAPISHYQTPPIVNTYAPPVTAVPIVPYVPILTPPAPPAPSTKTMLSKANGISYEQYLASGWTDQLLIQHGMMTP